MNKDIYLFISSTFIDMEDERDLLMLEVIPKVKKYCREKGLFLYPIDLRWGITEEQSKELNQTLRICLERVRDSKPLFLSFIGQRYGWVPTNEYLKDSIFDGCRDKIKGLSATELEILEALNGIIFNSEKKETLFYLRDPSYLDEIESKKVKAKYLDDNDSSKESISKLYNKLKEENNGKIYKAEFDNEKNHLINFYADGESLEDVIYNDLINKIDSLYPNEQAEERYRGQLLNEAHYYNALHCVDLIDVDDLVENGPREIFLIGNIGAGKTSLFASILRKFKEKYESEKHIILYRFESTSYFGDGKRFLHSFIEELNNFRHEACPPFDVTKTLAHYFYELNNLINLMVLDGYVIDVFIDEVDERMFDIILAMHGINRIVITSTLPELQNSKKYKSTINFEDVFRKEYSKVITYQFNEIGKNLTSKQCEAFKNEEDLFSLMTKIVFLKRFTSRKTIDSDIRKLKKMDFYEATDLYCKKLYEHLNDEDDECLKVVSMFFCLFSMVKENMIVGYLNYYFKKDVSATFYKLMLYLQDFFEEVNGIYSCTNINFLGCQMETIKDNFELFKFIYDDFINYYIQNSDEDKVNKLFFIKSYILQISSYGFTDLTVKSIVKHYDILVEYIKEFGLDLFFVDCTRIFTTYQTVELYFDYDRDDSLVKDLSNFAEFAMQNFVAMQNFPHKLGKFFKAFPDSYFTKNLESKYDAETNGLTVKDRKHEFFANVPYGHTSFGSSHDLILIPSKDNLLYGLNISTSAFEAFVGPKEKIVHKFSYAGFKDNISYINGLGEFVRYNFVSGETIKCKVKVNLSEILYGDCSFMDCFSYVDKNKVVHVLWFSGEEKTFKLDNINEIQRLVEVVYVDRTKVVLVTDRGIKEIYIHTNGEIEEYMYELPVFPKAVNFDEQGITMVVSCGNIFALYNGSRYIINSTVRVKSSTPFYLRNKEGFFIAEDNSFLCSGFRLENNNNFNIAFVTKITDGYLLLDEDGRIITITIENGKPTIKLI